MLNSDKFKIVQDVRVFETGTTYQFNLFKKYLSDKYYSSGVINAEELEQMLASLESGYMYVDFDLPSYDQETVDAAAKEYDPFQLIWNESTYGTQPTVVNTKLPLLWIKGSSAFFEDTVDIYAKYDKSTDKGIKIFHETGWGKSAKNAEIDQNTRQRGNSFMWSFINWVCYYMHTMVKRIYTRVSTLETWKKTATQQIKDLQTFQTQVTEQFQNYNQQLLDLTNRVTALENKESK